MAIWLECFYKAATEKTKKGILHVLELQPGATSDAPSASSVVASDWRPFYWNTKTGMTKWTKPLISQEQPVSPEVINENLKNHSFRWEKEEGVQILQNAIAQSTHGCAFAATAKQLDYQLRIAYAQALSPSSMTQGVCLVDHKEWERELSGKKHEGRWRPWELLKAAERGVPLFNGDRIYINYSVSLGLEIENVVDVLSRHPVFAVIELYDHYSKYGERIFMERSDKTIMFETGDGQQRQAFHAVVLIDVCDVGDRRFFAYQNSTDCPEKSMCKRGICWLESSMIREIYYGVTCPPFHPPSLMISKDQEMRITDEIDAALEDLKKIEFYEEGERRNLFEELWGSYNCFVDELLRLNKFLHKYRFLTSNSRFYKKYAKVYAGVENAKLHDQELKKRKEN